MGKVRAFWTMMLATTVLSGACAVADDDPELAWRTVGSGGSVVADDGAAAAAGAEDGGGGRTGGDWIINGLSEPAISGVSPAFPLDSPQGLGNGGWLEGDDEEDDGDDGDDEEEGESEGVKLIRYLVECALDDGDSISVEADDDEFVFQGRLGLAPEWKDEACDEACQEWVSACLLARINDTGEEHVIFVQGEHPSLGFGLDPAYPSYEGTFFGNVFVDPPVMHACRGSADGTTAAQDRGRHCTIDASYCGFTVHADCATQAGCDAGPTGVATIDCQPVANGPTYPGISVSLPAP